MSHIELPETQPKGLNALLTKPQSHYCNDVSWPLAFVHTTGLASYQYKLEYCDLRSRKVIRELAYTVNDKTIRLRYTLVKYSD